MEETVELDMYGFVFHFLPQYVYSLSPKDRSHLDEGTEKVPKIGRLLDY